MVRHLANPPGDGAIARRYAKNSATKAGGGRENETAVKGCPDAV